MALGLWRRRARRHRQPLVADRDARHELHAARLHHDRHAGQVDRAARPRRTSTAGHLLLGRRPGFPVQMFWALGFVAFAAMLFNRHRFGARVQRGRRQSRQRRANGHQRRPRFASRPSCSWDWAPRWRASFRRWSTSLGGRRPATAISCPRSPRCSSGERRPGAASAPSPAAPSARSIVSFIQSGIVAAGLSGFYVQFFNGLIIILALLGHRWNQKRFR